MEMILANGTRMQLSATENAQLFKAAQCSLGCLGVITTVTLQCEPTFYLTAHEIPSTFEETVPRVMQLATSAEHARFWWFPGTDDVVQWRANRVAPPSSDAASTATHPSSWFRDTLMGYHVFQMELFLSRYIPSMLPGIAKRKFQRFFSTPKTWTDLSWKVFNFDCLFSQHVSEWAIPIKHTQAALIDLRSRLEKADYPVHFPVEVRFSSGDDVWLSPAYGNEPVCWMNVIMYRPYHTKVPYKKFFWDFEEVMKRYEGRPHWAKPHSMAPEALRERYEKWEAFLEVRKRLDPDGIFANAYIERHLLGTKPVQTWSKL